MMHENFVHSNVPEGYRLVWNDEFDENKLDTTKWGFKPCMCGQVDLNIYEDERAVNVKDGCVVLPSDRESKGMYYTNTSLTTFNKMIFKSGYLEISAKVPFLKPAFPSFWMQSSVDKSTDPDVMGEIDIFEYFGKEPMVQTGIHKWYRDGSDHFLCPEIGRGIFDNRLIAEDFHTYGMLWTETELKFFVDGQEYHHIDITEDKNFGEREGSSMKCFHDYYYIIFNNYVNTVGRPTHNPEICATDDDKFPINYKIDYVRLYQKTGEEDIVIY